jgi:hypothetical protein
MRDKEKAKKQLEELDHSLEVLRAIAAENEKTKAKHDKDEEYLSRKKSRRERRAEEKARKREKRREPLTPVAKAILALLGAVAFCFAVYLIYYFLHIVNYREYEKYLEDFAYEAGSPFVPGSGSNVPGYELVCSNDLLELYTQTSTANVAVYDKRTGKTTYSNPPGADEDTVANGANKNFLKSQFLLYYYNDDVVSGSWNSYKDCVQAGRFEVESIADGVRYIYTIGDATAGFVVPLEYRLKEDYLEVSVPASEIQELGAGYVYRIQLLRYMGATSYDDEGYIVVPNGSGSIIEFNNGKTTAAAYSQYVYDIDPLAATYTNVEPLETARLPIFGLMEEDGGLLVSIEDSASNCVLNAEVSGAFNDYNYAFPTFVLRTVDDLKNFGDSATSVLVMEEEGYQSNIRVRYTFLTGEYGGYSGMANYYRERLVSEGVLVPNENDTDIPFYCDVITGVKETGHVLGVQYLHSFPMTTFDQAGQMADALAAEGITNQVMNLQGWFNGGYYHNATDSVHVMGKLGGKSGLEALNDKLASYDGTLYADVAFQKVTAADKGFPYTQVASRYYGSGYAARFGLVNPTTYRNTASLGYRENIYSALSPKFLPRYVSKFIQKSASIDVDGYSLRDLGNYLVSDKKRTNTIEREEAMDIVTGQLAALEATGHRLMTSQANAYAFAYSTDILSAPLGHTAYDIVDARIPLYEMILHGYINYSSDLLNYENNDDLPGTVLRMIECGASPHYVFTWEESSRMKLTALNTFYATTFTNWKDTAAETYREVNAALKSVQNEAIVKHEILDENVRKVTYNDGTEILINYGSEPATVGGLTVPARGYAVEDREWPN